jgi:hypothetical protein
MTLIIFLLLACISVVVFLLPYGLISDNPFPTPSGQWKVGTSNFIWNLPSHSGIIAKIWYPSSAKQDVRSPYIDYLDRTLSVMTTGLSPLSKLLLNRRYLSRIQAPSAINAALAQRHRRVGQLRDPRVRLALRSQQHDPRSLRGPGPNPIRASPTLKLLPITNT